jgi:hypothetical protein
MFFFRHLDPAVQEDKFLFWTAWTVKDPIRKGCSVLQVYSLQIKRPELKTSYLYPIFKNWTFNSDVLSVFMIECSTLLILSSFSQDPTAASEPGPSLYRLFTITLRRTTLGRTPLEERSARRRNLHLTTYRTYNRKSSTPPARFEPAFPASKRSPGLPNTKNYPELCLKGSARTAQ